jgi:hypothetical protein
MLKNVTPAVADSLQYRGPVFCAVRQSSGEWTPLALIGALVDYRDGTIGVYWPVYGDDPCDVHVYKPGEFGLVADVLGWSD